MILSLLKAVISLAGYIVKYAAEKQLLDAGSALEVRRNTELLLERIKVATVYLDKLNDDELDELRKKYGIRDDE